MSTENDAALNTLLTKVMVDRYCSQQQGDWEACVAHYVPQHGSDGSFVEQSLQRRGKKVCDPYQDVLFKCIQDDKKQNNIIKLASSVPECKAERNQYVRCQKAKGGNQCEQEAREMLMCGLAYIVSKQKKGSRSHQQQ